LNLPLYLLKRLKEKVDAGADYVTQMFFDNAKYFNLCQSQRNGIVPIIPGIKPLAGTKTFANFTANFPIDLSEDLIDAVDKCKTNADETSGYRMGYSAITRIELLGSCLALLFDG
jgi:5,10-methylenetetrahydrofolate reductase